MARPRSRAAETRDATQRPDPQSAFQSLLYFPRHLWPKGMTCRWIRVAAGAQPDNARWAQANMQGWKPMTLDHAPQYAIPNPDGTSQAGGIIRIGDLILCMKPSADVKRDREEQEGATVAQAAALDDYVRENPDADIPRFNRSGPTQAVLQQGAFKD